MLSANPAGLDAGELTHIRTRDRWTCNAQAGGGVRVGLILDEVLAGLALIGLFHFNPPVCVSIHTDNGRLDARVL